LFASGAGFGDRIKTKETGVFMGKVTRRSFVTTVGAAGVLPAAALLAPGTQSAVAAAAAKSAVPVKVTYQFFNAEEALFIEAACERLIPADESGPGAIAAAVPAYLDRQLNGAWGAGERLFRSGPWANGTPSQGYQLPFTPAELFHVSLRAVIRHLAAHGTPFNEMPEGAQDTFLKSLESGEHDLDGVPSAVFFDALLKMSIEGFFSDPVYGGNRDMGAWRMIGFPGAYADYFEAVDRHGVKFERAPMSLAEDAQHHIHVPQNIPAAS
jgi:gluconate 2-dehydrogenase gamma chain